MELVSKKRLMLFAGSRPPGALRGDRREPEGSARRRSRCRRFANGEIYCRYGESIRGADVFVLQTPLRADQRPHHGAAHHDRRREARVGEAHHRGVPVLRLRAPGPEGRGARADHGAPARRPAHRRRVPTASSPSTCTPGRSRASSTSPSTTSPPCRCSPTTSAARSSGEAVTVVAPDAGGGKLARRFANCLDEHGHRGRARVHRQAAPEGHAQRRRRQGGRRRGRGPHLRARSTT